MDKRSSVRIPLQLDVDIYNCGCYLGRGTTRNIHIDGAFIRDYTGELFHNDVLELVIVPCEEFQKPVYMRGMVVRGCSEGVGVLFGYGETEFRRLLKKLFNNTEDECAYAAV